VIRYVTWAGRRSSPSALDVRGLCGLSLLSAVGARPCASSALCAALPMDSTAAAGAAAAVLCALSLCFLERRADGCCPEEPLIGRERGARGRSKRHRVVRVRVHPQNKASQLLRHWNTNFEMICKILFQVNPMLTDQHQEAGSWFGGWLGAFLSQ